METNNSLEDNNNTELDQLWEKLEKSIKKVVKDTLGFEERRKPIKKFSDMCKRAIEEHNAIRMVRKEKLKR